eukprot:PhF_6_TR38669/c0_g1_i1/m.57845
MSTLPPLAIDPSYSKVLDDAVDIKIMSPPTMPINQVMVTMYLADPHKGRPVDIVGVVDEAIRSKAERPTPNTYGFCDTTSQAGIACSVVFDKPIIPGSWALSTTILPTFACIATHVTRYSYLNCATYPRFQLLLEIMSDYHASHATTTEPWILGKVHEARCSTKDPNGMVLHENAKYTAGGFVVAQLKALFKQTALSHLQSHSAATGTSWELLTVDDQRGNVLGVTASDVHFSPPLRELGAFINLSQLISCVRVGTPVALCSKTKINKYNHRLPPDTQEECPSLFEAIQILCGVTNTRKVLCNKRPSTTTSCVSVLLKADSPPTTYVIQDHEDTPVVDVASNLCHLPGVDGPIPISNTYLFPELVITLSAITGRTAAWAQSPSIHVSSSSSSSFLVVHFITDWVWQQPPSTSKSKDKACFSPTDCMKDGCAYVHDDSRVLYVVSKPAK